MRKWWPALDGLRGLAVAAVVIYHLDERLLPGGFLGVSLFFAISGFLIVGQLAIERETTGRVDLVRFWTRRIRRLGPALMVTLLATTVVVSVIDVESLRRVAIQALAGVAYVANWHDMTSPVTYAERFGTVIEPLGHIWSLSIEEQMYLVAPLLIAWLGIKKAGWIAVAVVGAGIALWWGSPDAYLATPVRLVEVLAGAWLGVRIYRGRAAPRWLVRAGAPAAIVAVVVLATVADNNRIIFTWFLPAVSLVWVALLAAATTEGRFASVLSHPVLVWVGARSYAIYLFHVPLIELTDWSPVVVVAVTLALAELSHRIIESPVRRGVVPLRLVLAGVAGVAVSVAGLSFVKPQQPDVAAALQQAITTTTTVAAPSAAVRPTTTVAVPATTPAVVSAAADVAETPSTEPVTPTLPVSPHMLVVGDSTAHSLQPALEAFVASRSGELVGKALSGCSPMFDRSEEWNLRFSTKPDGFVPAAYCRPSVGSLIDDHARLDGDSSVGGSTPIDVVLMMDHGMAIADHQPVGEPGVWLSIIDPRLRAALMDRYDAWVVEAEDRGAVTILVTLADGPVVIPDSASKIVDRSERVAAYNEIVRSVASAHPKSVILLDIAAAVESDPERYDRPDGIHFSEADGAVAVVADFVVPLFPSLP